ncbi:hypothetical protein I3842_10G122900 [Carya illinoinensis]|uniref:Reverse transcriptase zinc-binding domain-containing protein n=1 Tax=Carya illinoinensis TaxID=32201 RepID=A0A922J3Z0_CARIL|nr:hypothetical protein I3842_10G122900 [Carya illinoinensis]
MHILNSYEQASGQLLNKEKSSIYFSRNTLPESRAHILRIVGVTSTGSFERYLGLPTMVGRAKNMLQKPTSLPAITLKQKYFPRGSILDAKVGSQLSLAWRTLHAGIKLLKEGLQWRIGNGSRVKIWEDRWRPRPCFLGPPSRSNTSDEVRMVADLIGPSLRRWDDNTLTTLFTQQEVDLIKSIPISLGKREDKMVWGGTINGIFSVKSAYHMHIEIQSNQDSGPSTVNNQKELWKGVWNLKVPNGVRMFLWRACKNRCPICGLEEETSGHASWNCEATCDVWSQASRPIQKLSLDGSYFKEIWMQMSVKLPQTLLEEAGLIVRLIWTRRNEFVHGKDFRHPNSIADQTAITTENSERTQKWKSPPEGMYKMNWDAAINQPMGLIGIGGLIRDSKGQVLGSLRAKRSLTISPFTAKAYAMMMTVLLCSTRLCFLEHTKRDSNMVAHMLAKDALSSDCDLYGLEEIPSCIRHVVHQESL